MAFNLCHFLPGLGPIIRYVEANGRKHLANIIDEYISPDTLGHVATFCF